MSSRKVEKHKDGMRRVRVGNKIMGTLPSEATLGKQNKDILNMKTRETNSESLDETTDTPDLDQMREIVQNKKILFNKFAAREALNDKAAEQVRYYQQLAKRYAEGDYESHDEINILYAVDVDNPSVGYRETYLKTMPDGSCFLKIITHTIPHTTDEDMGVGEETPELERNVEGINLSKETYLPDYPDTERAQSLSYDVHFGQTDKLGVPYYHHPAGVAEYLETLSEYEELSDSEKEDARVAAWLHDSVEDTGITLDVLRKQKFSEGAIATIEALTMHKHESREQYYERILSSGHVARAVKLADLGHNTLPSRRETLPGSPSNPVSEGQNDTFARLGRKYAKAFKALGADVPKHLREYS